MKRERVRGREVEKKTHRMAPNLNTNIHSEDFRKRSSSQKHSKNNYYQNTRRFEIMETPIASQGLKLNFNNTTTHIIIV